MIIFFTAILAILLILYKYQRKLYVLHKTFKRDLRILLAYIRLKYTIFKCQWYHLTVSDIFSAIARKNPHKVAIYFENEIWTYDKIDRFSNKIAKYYQSKGYKKGDCIALMLKNSAEFECIWLGLSKIGLITALINTNLVSATLLHTLVLAKPKAIIIGSDLIENLKVICKDLKLYQLYQLNESEDDVTKLLLQSAIDLRKELEEVSDYNLIIKDPPNENDILFYINTSGTTGLPKAVPISNMRFVRVAKFVYYACGFSKMDNLYIPLPLYHTLGNIGGGGQAFTSEVAITIKKKFSATQYWEDCKKYNCTCALYIGEMCRYLLAATDKVTTNHSVKSILGIGLKPQLWKQFIDTFNIKTVYECYGTTEGNTFLVNVDNTIGSVGAIPVWIDFFSIITLLKCQETSGEPIKNSEDLLIKCKPNEAGLIAGLIDNNSQIFNFKGYINGEETKKKILRDVFKKGDRYFNSGDIMVKDEFGNIFFKDRTGDSFRWKGENVSTAEVEGVITRIINFKDAVVYGVKIPGLAGKAGMAAIVDEDKSIDIVKLCADLNANLPSYSIPIFIRLMETVQLTETFKLKKADLKLEGFDISKIKDKIYFYDSKLKKYIEFTQELNDMIETGKLTI